MKKLTALEFLKKNKNNSRLLSIKFNNYSEQKWNDIKFINFPYIIVISKKVENKCQITIYNIHEDPAITTKSISKKEIKKFIPEMTFKIYKDSFLKLVKSIYIFSGRPFSLYRLNSIFCIENSDYIMLVANNTTNALKYSFNKFKKKWEEELLY